MTSLKNQIRDLVTDRSVSGLIAETVLEPLAGPGTPVSPPTYAAREDSAERNRKDPTHAVSEHAFMPARDPESGWHNQFERQTETGEPRDVTRVVLNSYQAESGIAETALWNNQDRFGLALPGVVLSGAPLAHDAESPALAEALRVALSTWQLSHRQNDAWVKYAAVDQKTQVWQQPLEFDEDGRPTNLKSIITSASQQRADLLFSYFPNSSVYGFWLSSGVAQRHRLARAYTSEIVGFGARPIVRAATKLDAMGGASNRSHASVSNGALTVADTTSTKKTGSTSPSNLGLGQVPRAAHVSAYACELILQQASISLQLLRTLRYQSAEQATAATTVLVLLAMTGHELANEERHLRSGCDLVAVDWKWGIRRAKSRTPEKITFNGVDDIIAALKEALADAEASGLAFADPVTLSLSEAEGKIIAQRVAEEAAKASAESE